MLKLLRRSSPAPDPHVPAVEPAEVRAAPSSAPVDPRADDEAVATLLDAVGGLLHAVGRYALETETTSEHEAQLLADRWRRHVTLGFDHPDEGAAGGAGRDGEGDDAPRARRGVALPERDWAGMVRFAVGQQRGERERALRVRDELRDTVWTLVRGLSEVVGGDAESGREAVATLDRVRAAIADAPPEHVRDAALGALADLASAVARRERARREQVTALGDEIARLGAALEEARREGSVDPLTGFGNRRALDEALGHAATLHALWGHGACLVVLDVDGLRAVNEAGGHPAGDDAIRAVAAELSRVFLRRDDTLCRTGGDEFAVVLRDTTPADARRLAERVISGVASRAAQRADGAGALPAWGVSAGVAGLADGETVAAWLSRADDALFAAKSAGRGRVVVG